MKKSIATKSIKSREILLQRKKFSLLDAFKRCSEVETLNYHHIYGVFHQDKQPDQTFH